MKTITFGFIARFIFIFKKGQYFVSFGYENRFDQNIYDFISRNESLIGASKSSAIICFHTFPIIIINLKRHNHRQDESKMLTFEFSIFFFQMSLGNN